MIIPHSIIIDVMSNLNRYFGTFEENFEISPDKRIPCGRLKLAEPIGQGINEISFVYCSLRVFSFMYTCRCITPTIIDLTC